MNELSYVNFKESLLSVDKLRAESVIENVFSKNNNIEIIEEIIIRALEEIGLEWQNGEVSLAQVYMSGVITEEIISNYVNYLNQFETNQMKLGIAVLFDHHSLGKSIVSSIVKSNGYELVDLGTGLSVEEIYDKSLDNKIEILLISVLMLNSAKMVKELSHKFHDNNKNVKIIVGGAPFRLNEKLWQDVKADAYCKTASEIIGTLREMIDNE